MSNIEPRIPVIRVDYQSGKFINTMTGEVSDSLQDVLMLEWQKEQVLWPEWAGKASLPMCVNGSDKTRGPCEQCRLRLWQGETPPMCTEELSVVLQVGNSIALLVARRSMMRPIDQWIGMQDMMGNPLFGQELSLNLIKDYRNSGDLHRIAVIPGRFLSQDEQAQKLLIRDRAKLLMNDAMRLENPTV